MELEYTHFILQISDGKKMNIWRNIAQSLLTHDESFRVNYELSAVAVTYKSFSCFKLKTEFVLDLPEENRDLSRV